jgi:hypothetical protein
MTDIDNEAKPPVSMVIWRVQKASCDGGRLGRVWGEYFYFTQEQAVNHMMRAIRKRNESNPKYLFETEPETINGVTGYCNWQFSVMIAVNSVTVSEQEAVNAV